MSQTSILAIVTIAGFLASLGGVWLAWLWGDPSIGHRGGAIGVALSFAALFAARDTTTGLLEVRRPDGNSVWTHGDDTEKFAVLRSAIAVMIDGSAIEKRYLTWVSVVSTLVAGFGDLVAAWIIRVTD